MNIETYMSKYHPDLTSGIYEAFNKGDAPWVLKQRIRAMAMRQETKYNAIELVAHLYNEDAKNEA